MSLQPKQHENELGHVLTTLEALGLSDHNEYATGPNAQIGIKDKIKNMGLNLGDSLFPTVSRTRTDRQTTQLMALTTYMLFRGNYGGDGVVWSRKDIGATYNATVLFISKTGNYDDTYLDYLEEQRQRVHAETTTSDSNLPEILYQYPHNSKQDIEHLKYLQTDDPQQSQYTNFYDTPKANVYIFYKMTADDQKDKSGPYLFFGRFQVMPRLLEQGKMIRLKYYEPPLEARLQYQESNRSTTIASIPLTISQDDVSSVISDLSKRSKRKSKLARRDAPAAVQSLDSDDSSDGSQYAEVFDTVMMSAESQGSENLSYASRTTWATRFFDEQSDGVGDKEKGGSTSDGKRKYRIPRR